MDQMYFYTGLLLCIELRIEYVIISQGMLLATIRTSVLHMHGLEP